MEREAFYGENFSIATAAKRQGGIVIAQVERLAAAGTLPGRQVKVPGVVVDYLVLAPDQRQTYQTRYSAAYAGELREPDTAIRRIPFDIRKVIARRAAMELLPRRRRQPRLRRLERDRQRRGRGGLLPRAHADRRAGHHRRRAGGRPGCRRRRQLRHDGGPALPVRLLRRRRPRHRVPLVRRGRSGTATSTSAATAAR